MSGEKIPEIFAKQIPKGKEKYRVVEYSLFGC